MQFPAELGYTKEHAWVRIEGGAAIVGITDHAQKALGDIVYVELPRTGAELAPGRPYGVVESVKSVSDLIAPVRGSVARVNTALQDTPELINKDPYGAGWIAAVTLAGPIEAAGLLTAAEYEGHLAELAT